MHSIHVVGLGPGDKDQMPLNITQMLIEADRVFLKTENHPAVEELKKEGLVFESFDYLYKEDDVDTEQIYSDIVETLVGAAEERTIVYAVPGHPLIADKSVKALRDKYSMVTIDGGKSLIDDLLAAVEVDPLEGFQLFGSEEMDHDTVNTGQPVIVMQVFNAMRAKEVKVSLMEKYPEDHSVAAIDAPGSRQENIAWMPLYDIDRFEGVHHLRTLYVPPLELDEQVTSLSTLQNYIDRVTDPVAGDVWINEQTPKSLIRYLREETEEVIEAIEKDDSENWMEELGDVLVQLLYQTSIAEKQGQFTFENVLETVNRKIRRRHPHVFDGVEAATAEEVDALWQKIKAEEKRKKDET